MLKWGETGGKSYSPETRRSQIVETGRKAGIDNDVWTGDKRCIRWLNGAQYLYDYAKTSDAFPGFNYYRAMHFIPLAPLLGVGSANQCLAAHWREGQGLLDQPLKQQPTRAGGSPVEPECELIQVVIQMCRGHRPLMRSQKPSLQQCRHAIGSGQEILTHHRALPHHRMTIAFGLESRIAAPEIGRASCRERVLRRV